MLITDEVFQAAVNQHRKSTGKLVVDFSDQDLIQMNDEDKKKRLTDYHEVNLTQLLEAMKLINLNQVKMASELNSPLNQSFSAFRTSDMTVPVSTTEMEEDANLKGINTLIFDPNHNYLRDL